MRPPKDRETLTRHLQSTIRREMRSGVSHWTGQAWNEAARAFLHGGPPAQPATRLAGPSAPARRAPAAQHPTSVRKAPAARQDGASRPKFGAPPKAVGRARDWKKQLADVGAEASQCTQCSLHETRTNVVFETGRASVPLVFVGEAPGRDEDLQGLPFVGRAGQLLTRIIEAMGLRREDVYICNVLKCRPPNNRDPQPDEVSSCVPYLERQLDILKPRVICALGRHSTQTLLGRKDPIGKLRGRVFLYRGVKMVATYHPAALLRNPGLKRTVWEDVQLVRRLLDDPDCVPAEGGTTAPPRPRTQDQSLGF
jgi:DNA polymerase